MVDQLEKFKQEIGEKAMELWKGAEETMRVTHWAEAKEHHRYFLVDLYKENTEIFGCLGFLAQISRWFPVRPLTKKELKKLKVI